MLPKWKVRNPNSFNILELSGLGVFLNLIICWHHFSSYTIKHLFIKKNCGKIPATIWYSFRQASKLKEKCSSKNRLVETVLLPPWLWIMYSCRKQENYISISLLRRVSRPPSYYCAAHFWALSLVFQPLCTDCQRENDLAIQWLSTLELPHNTCSRPN